jgi:hypothetical protein
LDVDAEIGLDVLYIAQNRSPRHADVVYSAQYHCLFDIAYQLRQTDVGIVFYFVDN